MFNKIYENIKKFMVNNWKYIVFLVAIYVFFMVELPYVIYAPGGSIDLSERIEVENGHDSSGKLQMAYVSMVKGSIPFVLLSNVLPNWDLEKKEDVTMDNESLEDMVKRDRIYLQQSIDNAIIESYKITGNKVEIIKNINNVAYITPEADTNLELLDDILEYDNHKFTDFETFKNYIESKNIGDKIEFLVLRNNKEKKSSAKVYESSEGKKIGISIITTYKYKTEPEVVIKSKEAETGPSGGLMLTLGIYNELTNEDITKGRNIIGTGTIETNGIVGPIGGVKYKLIGAVNNKADLFICPIENYEEALKIKEENDFDIKLIGVHTLEDAINELKK